MDYEQDEQEEQYEEVQAELQAEAMEIDEDDAPYLDLRDARERQGYAQELKLCPHPSLRSGTPNQNWYVRRLR